MIDARPGILALAILVLVVGFTGFRTWQIRSEASCLPAGRLELGAHRQLHLCITDGVRR